MAISRRNLLKGGAVVGAGGPVVAEAVRDSDADVSRSSEWGNQAGPEPYDEYEIHRVSTDGGEYSTIQDAVDSAESGDLILLEPGVYTEIVNVHETPGLTIRGLDRNEVVLDGEFERYTGITVTADDVVVENLTVRNYRENGVYWTGGVEGYRASYVTAYNNQVYGIYAFNSRYGRFEHCLASGCRDAGFYIGESQPADAVITDCLAQHNALGYSGTNAGGNLVIRDSTWRNNICGLVPNTLDSQSGAPQGHVAGGIRIENNHIHDNNNLDAPSEVLGYPLAGNGITIAGGTRNDVVGNTVSNQEKYGIAVTPIMDKGFYRPRDNAVMRNTVQESGRADLALAAPAKGNRFADNEFDSSRPAFLERRDGSFGDVWIFVGMLKDFGQAEYTGNFPHGETENQPVPDPQPGMDDPEGTPPRTPVGGR
jgi:hypothetical protein